MRIVATSICLLSLTLAGCLGGGPPKVGDGDELPTAPVVQWVLDSTGAVLDASAFPGELPAFDIVKVSDRISGEPTIGITRTGAVFYPAIDFDAPGNLPRTVYMRSVDGGATWEDRSPRFAGVETHPTSFDPYVYVDPTTGRVFAMDMGPHVACNKVSWSDDDGATWITRDGACIPGANDHPTLFAGPATFTTATDVYPNQLYLCTNQITDSICYQSPDGGITWVATSPAYIGLRDANSLCGGLTGHGHVSWTDGTIYLGREWCGTVTTAVSRDGGLTWERITISDKVKHTPEGHDVSIGTDRAGNAYAFWVGDQGRSVFLSRSFDRGASWTEPIDVTAPNVTAVKLPSLVAGSDGRIAFLYVGTDTPRGWDVHETRSCEAGETAPCYVYPEEVNATKWHAYIGVSLNADQENPVIATVLANPVDSPLKRGGCTGRCFGDEGGMYDFLDIEIDPRTGQLWAALVDVCSGDCDGPGKGKFTVQEKAVGAAARMIGGTPLLVEAMSER